MRIVAETGSTVLMVTHDVDEAVLLSDRTGMVRCGIGYHVDGAAHFHKRRLSRRCACDHGTS